MDTNVHPMFAHIHASLREKVEILATNPYRYYVGPNRLLHHANLEADDVLIQRILEVQQQLLAKYKIDL